MEILISQPMAGVPDEELRKRFTKLKEQFAKMHINVINNIWEDDIPEGKYYCEPLFYLSQSIDAIGKVDAVYFAEGWQEARGCRVEHLICREYGIKCLYPDFFEKDTLKECVAPISAIKISGGSSIINNDYPKITY